MENGLSNNVIIIAILSCLPASVHFASLSHTVSKEKEAEVTTTENCQQRKCYIFCLVHCRLKKYNIVKFMEFADFSGQRLILVCLPETRSSLILNLVPKTQCKL